MIRGTECVPRRDGSEATGLRSAAWGKEDSADEDSEERRGLENDACTQGNQGSLEECKGLQRVVVLTPDGRGFEFSVVSQRTAARYTVGQAKLQTPVMLEGPSGVPTELCTIAFSQEKAVGGKMVIYVYVVDALEEYYEAPHGGLQRWQMQLGADDDGFLQWL